MVKKAMKDHKKDDKTLQRALHSRQMGLKFLANVTYGYTAANFSGRMPCIEVRNSIYFSSLRVLLLSKLKKRQYLNIKKKKLFYL